MTRGYDEYHSFICQNCGEYWTRSLHEQDKKCPRCKSWDFTKTFESYPTPQVLFSEDERKDSRIDSKYASLDEYSLPEWMGY